MNEPQDEENKKSNTIDSLEESSPKNETGNAAHASAEEEPAVKAEEYQSLNSKYLRLAAEFDNYKRLSQRDQRDQIRFGNEQLLKELLPVVDNMERAIKAARTNGGGDSALVQGVELTLKQLSGVLAKFGVQAIDSAGQDFDPSAHQAVSYGPVPANKVLDEFQKGYRLHDRILRAAMVSVSSGPAQANEHDATTN